MLKRKRARTPGAFLGGLRVVAVDRTVFDAPDTEANARLDALGQGLIAYALNQPNKARVKSKKKEAENWFDAPKFIYGDSLFNFYF